MGLVAGGAAEARSTREATELRARQVGLQERQFGLEEETAARKSITDAISATRSEIDGLITAARDAKAKGAPAERLKPIRRLIETLGGQLGVAIPGVPMPKGAAPVPGAEAIVQTGLQRFDALVGATPGPAPKEPEAAFAGSGFEAATANIVTKLANKMRSGVPLTGEEQMAYSIAYGKLTEPKTVASPTGGFQIIQPTLDANLFPAPSGSTPSPAGTPGPRTGGTAGLNVSKVGGPVTANEAGRTELVAAGAQNATDVFDAIVNPDGSINRDTIFTMTTDIPLIGRGVPGTEGRNIRAKFEDAAAAKLRLETGAQANEQEIQNIVDRFMPSNFDSDSTVKSKMERMKGFFTGSLARTDPEMFGKLTSRAKAEGKIPAPPANEAEAEFTGFDPMSGAAVYRRPNGTHFGVPRGR